MNRNLPLPHRDSTPASRLARRPQVRTRAARRAVVEALEDRRLLSFGPAATYAATLQSLAIGSADFNGDGRLDLVSANGEADSVSVLLSNVNGTFQAAQNFATGPFPRSVAVGDFNGDGKADIVTANGGNSSFLVASASGGSTTSALVAGNVSVLSGNGDGTFQAAQNLTLPGQVPVGNPGVGMVPQTPVEVAVGDMNGDGKLDLTVSARAYTRVLTGSGYYGNYYQPYVNDYVNVLVGNGSGGFTHATAAPTNQNNLGTPFVALADFNGDHKLDVITGATPRVILGNGNGTLQAPLPTIGFAVDAGSVSAGDFDNDGKADLVLRDGFGDINVLKGLGDGTFQNTGAIAHVSYYTSTAVGDVNADGKLDVVFNSVDVHYASYGYYGGYDPTTTDHATVVLGYGDGTFATPIASTTGSYPDLGHPTSTLLGDFNGDGLLDLASVSFIRLGISVALNDGNWVAARPPPIMNVSDATVTEGNAGTVNAVFTVTLDRASANAVTVQYKSAGGTAVAGRDFDSYAATLTFAPGETSKTFSIVVRGDVTDEYDENFYVNLTGAAGAVLADSQGIGTIVDNDPPPNIIISDVMASEGRSGSTPFNFTVSLSAPSEKDVFVNYATANGSATTADKDYFAKAGTLHFAPGQTSQRIAILVLGDKRKEAKETFFVNLSGASDGIITDAQGVGTILDDDASPGKIVHASRR